MPGAFRCPAVVPLTITVFCRFRQGSLWRPCCGLRRFFATTPSKPHASLTTDHDQTTGITTMKRTALLAAILTFALAGPALAHTGAGATHGFAEGFGHPFSGADHILAMVCVGLW